MLSRCILPALTLASVGLGQSQTKQKVGLPPIIGTITEHNPLGGGFVGIWFELKEHPERRFIWETKAVEHQGRYLKADLKGLRVRVTGEKPEDSLGDEFHVTALTWLNATPNMATLTGTIMDSRPMAVIAFSPSPTPAPARFTGIRFHLREYPKRVFEFSTTTFEYQGRNLLENANGERATLRTFCQKPEEGETEQECAVSSLTWATPTLPATKKTLPSGKK